MALAMAGVAPNIFPIAQGGYADMPWLATRVLLPSIDLLMVVWMVAALEGERRLVNRLFAGATAGILATAGLEVIRIMGFRLGWMPGDLPKLLGVLLLDRFMQGPSLRSNIAGYAYHYWNGAAFGIVYGVLLGRKPTWWGILYGLAIATVFLMSPAVRVTGAGFMGMEMPMMPITVYTAHLVFGVILGWLSARWIGHPGWLLSSAEERKTEPGTTAFEGGRQQAVHQ